MMITKIERKKVIKFLLPKGMKFTGRELSAKLVISKNKDMNGRNITMLFKRYKNRFYFIPIADIYLDFNEKILIMPKYHPVPVLSQLYRDIIPSVKYRGCCILAPDSDFQPIFKEIQFRDGKILWVVVFDEITLHLYTFYNDDEDEEFHEYLSTHQINVRIKNKAKEKAKEKAVWYRECQQMTDELFEEAGYDFMD